MRGQEFNYMPSFESVPYLSPSGACWFLSTLKLIPITLFGWFNALAGPDVLLLLPRYCFILKFMFPDRRLRMVQMILLNEQEQLGNMKDLLTEKRSVRRLAKLEDLCHWMSVFSEDLYCEDEVLQVKPKLMSRGASFPFLGFWTHPSTAVRK